MGSSTYSDIVENVAYIGNQKIPNTWEIFWEGDHIGKSKRLYADAFVKIIGDKIYAIYLINRSEYDYDGVVCSLSDEAFADVLKDDDVPASLGDISKLIPAGGIESLKLLLKEMNSTSKILPLDSVHQTV